jgi:electron transfer flavoprotein alpha subunit
MPDILVYALHYDGAFNKNSLGAVSEAARLAPGLGGAVDVIVVGDSADDELCRQLGHYGARKVYRVPGPEARIGAGVAMEVTGIRVDGGKLIAQRPIIGDAQISEISFRSDVGIIIGRLNAFEIAQSAAADAEVQETAVEFSPFSTRARMISRGEQRGEAIDIEGADILIAGGRGLGNAEGFALCEELAQAFGARSAVAATRAVVDAGWYSYAAQIGQTGKTVSPKLYLAAGISGAIQHKVGMQASENIVAINKDANAPIFEFSDLGIVGDLNKILPKLSAAVRAKRAE